MQLCPALGTLHCAGGCHSSCGSDACDDRPARDDGTACAEEDDEATSDDFSSASARFMWPEPGAVEELPILAGKGGKRPTESPMIDIAADSGAAVVVAPPALALGYALKSSAGSRAGTQYRTASGAVIANQGEERANVHRGWPTAHPDIADR